MKCGSCGASTRFDGNRGLFICDYCRAEFVPPIGTDGVQVLEPTKLHCPACQGFLSNSLIEKFPLHYCQSCWGLLVSMDDFLPLTETLRSYRHRPAAYIAPRGPQSDGPARVCPKCSCTMNHHPYGGPGNVWIDTCERCSVNWLDKGELQKIVSAPDPALAPVYSDYGDTC